MLTGVLIGSIFSGLLAVFGLYRLVQYFRFARRVRSKSAWPETAGTVVEGLTGYTPGMRGGKVYYAVIDFHYLVQGHKYLGKVKKTMFWGQGEAKRFIEKYPADSAIQVHYNPARPEESVSALDKSRAYLGLSLVIFLFGFLGVVAAFTTR